jgi:PQ loop repeat
MILEMLMLICFGAAWPFSVYKSYKSKSIKGKSISFLLIILFGYVFGIFNKVFNKYDWVTYFYLLNTLLVFADIILYFRNRRLSKEKNFR